MLRKLKLKKVSNSEEDDKQIGIFATPKRPRTPPGGSVPIVFAKNRDPTGFEVFSLFEQHYSRNRHPPPAAGALDLYHSYTQPSQFPLPNTNRELLSAGHGPSHSNEQFRYSAEPVLVNQPLTQSKTLIDNEAYRMGQQHYGHYPPFHPYPPNYWNHSEEPGSGSSK